MPTSAVRILQHFHGAFRTMRQRPPASDTSNRCGPAPVRCAARTVTAPSGFRFRTPQTGADPCCSLVRTLPAYNTIVHALLLCQTSLYTGRSMRRFGPSPAAPRCYCEEPDSRAYYCMQVRESSCDLLITAKEPHTQRVGGIHLGSQAGTAHQSEQHGGHMCWLSASPPAGTDHLSGVLTPRLAANV